MFEVGRLCIKIAGRDANKKCVIINVIDPKLVMIDGETRRRKCNIAHLEPLNDVIKISKDASHDEVKKEFDKLGLKAKDTKPKEVKEKPKKTVKKKEAPKKEKTVKKVVAKKDSKKTVKKTEEEKKVTPKETKKEKVTKKKE